MATQQTRSEFLFFAKQAAAGTPAATPSHYLNYRSLIDENEDTYSPEDPTGTYEESARDVVVHRSGAVSGTGALDARVFPFWMEGICGGSNAITTPVGATNARQHVNTPNNNDLALFTIWGGDPDNLMLRMHDAVINQFVITADGSGNNGTTLQLGFIGSEVLHITDPGDAVTPPTLVLAPILIPKMFEVWVDNLTQGQTIGGTDMLGTIYSVQHTVNLTRELIYLPDGPSGGYGPTETGRGTHRMNTQISGILNTNGVNLYSHWKADDLIAIRVKHNSKDVIESTTRFSVTVDNYGKFRDMGWQEYANTSRAVQLTLNGLHNTAINASFRMTAITDLATLASS